MPQNSPACGLRGDLGGATDHSEIAAERLLALDRLEKRLEVPLAEPTCAVTLDHLEEERRPVLGSPREDLQQVPVLIPVDEDAQATQVVPVLADLADARHRILVVGLGGREELDAETLQRLDAAHDVFGLQRDVLHAGTAEELEVLLDLALALSLGRLVDRELDLPLAVRHHLRHQRGVLGVDLLVGEVDDVREAHRPFVKLDPVVHPAELDVPDDVVDRSQTDAGRRSPVRPCDLAVTREERPGVLAPVDEGMDVVAVRGDRRPLDPAEVVFGPMRLAHSTGSTLNRLPIGVGRIRDGQRRVLDTVAMGAGEAGDLAVRAETARQDEADVGLLDDVGRAVANTGFRPRVRGSRETECVLVEEGGLLGIADVQLEVIPPVDRHEVGVLPHPKILLSRRPGSSPARREGDPACDRDSADDLHGRNRLREQDERDDRREERLQVREERCARRAHAVDRREPEQVGDHERPEHGEREPDPDERAEVVALVGELLRPRQGEQRRHGEQEDRTEPERGISPHERADRHRVGGPGGRTANGERVPFEVRRQASARTNCDQRDARERHQRCDPEADAQMLDARASGEEGGEDRQRSEQQRDGRRSREAECVDEAQLVREQHRRTEDDDRQVPSSHPQRPLPDEGDRGEDQRRAGVADGGVRERPKPVVEDVLRNGEVERPQADRRKEQQIGGRTVHGGALYRGAGPSIEGKQRACDADSYKVPLRTICWLLLAVVGGSTIGLKLALPESDSAPPAASAQSAAGGPAPPFTFAPPGGRRVVHSTGLDISGGSTPGLRPLTASRDQSFGGSNDTSTRAGEEAPAVGFDAPYVSDLRFLALPGIPTSPTTTNATDTTTTMPAAPVGPPPEIENVHTTALTPFSATIAWRTSVSASSRIAYGLDAPVIWTPASDASTEHQATLTGLGFDDSYKLAVTAVNDGGAARVAEFVLTTPSLSG